MVGKTTFDWRNNSPLQRDIFPALISANISCQWCDWTGGIGSKVSIKIDRIIPKITHMEGNWGYISYPRESMPSARAKRAPQRYQYLFGFVSMTSIDKNSSTDGSKGNSANSEIHTPDREWYSEKIDVKKHERNSRDRERYREDKSLQSIDSIWFCIIFHREFFIRGVEEFFSPRERKGPPSYPVSRQEKYYDGPQDHT